MRRETVSKSSFLVDHGADAFAQFFEQLFGVVGVAEETAINHAIIRIRAARTTMIITMTKAAVVAIFAVVLILLPKVSEMTPVPMSPDSTANRTRMPPRAMA